jgi:hypothetical protein
MQDTLLIMFWPQLQSFLLCIRLWVKSKNLSFIWTIRRHISQKQPFKNCVNTGQTRSSSILLTGFGSARLLSLWLYQSKDRLSRIRVSRWLTWGDKRGIWPPFKVRSWQRVLRMTDSYPDLSRLSMFLFSRGLNNGLFPFLITQSDLEILTGFRTPCRCSLLMPLFLVNASHGHLSARDFDGI